MSLINTKAPDFMLKDQAGTMHSLAEYAGMYVLLYFYPKDDTPGCTIEAKEFSELHEAFATLGVQIVGVSKDLTPSHCAFIQKYTLKPLYLSDPELILHKQFGVRGAKSSWGKIFS